MKIVSLCLAKTAGAVRTLNYSSKKQKAAEKLSAAFFLFLLRKSLGRVKSTKKKGSLTNGKLMHII